MLWVKSALLKFLPSAVLDSASQSERWRHHCQLFLSLEIATLQIVDRRSGLVGRQAFQACGNCAGAQPFQPLTQQKPILLSLFVILGVLPHRLGTSGIHDFFQFQGQNLQSWTMQERSWFLQFVTKGSPTW